MGVCVRVDCVLGKREDLEDTEMRYIAIGLFASSLAFIAYLVADEIWCWMGRAKQQEDWDNSGQP